MDGAASRTQRGRWRWFIGAAVVVTGVGAVAAPTAATPEPASKGSLDTIAQQIGADDAWAQGHTGDGVTVAVIDTGVVPAPALDDPNKVVAVVDLSGEARVPEARYLDTFGHGTHIAGIIAGRDDDTGFRGIAPDASLVSIKVADNSGQVDISQVIAGVDWVVDHAEELDIDVINLSYSSGSEMHYRHDPLSFAVERAWRAGIVVVVAAGNDGSGEYQLASPADNPYVIAVAAVEQADDGRFTVPDWATSGAWWRPPDVAAPGSSVESVRVPGSRIDVEHPSGYVDELLFKGTGSSQAAAVVSGSVALLLDARPDLTPDEVKSLLKWTADDDVDPWLPMYSGNGLVQVDAAIAGTPPPYITTQHWWPAVGDGSIEAARNGVHVTVDGVTIEGEITVLGTPWHGASWAGARWTGASWAGASWAGASWAGASWAGARWTGASWVGASWAADSWAGARWSGASWAGASWAGASWADESWSGARWTGDGWVGARWSGASWSGDHWLGVRW